MNVKLKRNGKRAILACLVIALTACGGADERKLKYLEKGKAYLAENNYDKAKVEIKNVLQIDPKFAEAYYIMGQLEEKDKKLGIALGNYKKAIELDPGHNDAKTSLSKIYVIANSEELLTKAKFLLGQVLSADPDNNHAKLILASIEYKMGSKDKAQKQIELIVNEDMSLVEGIGLLSSIYSSNNQIDKSIDLLKKATEVNPDNVPLRLSLARMLSSRNDLIGAERYLKETVAINPDGYSLKVALSSFYAVTDQLDKAEKILRQAIEEKDDDAQRYLVLVEFLGVKRSIQIAEQEIISAIKRKPDIYELRFAQVRFYEKINNYDKAKSILRYIIEEKNNDSDGVKARIKLAEYLLAEGSISDAKKTIDKVLVEHPNNNDALMVSGQIALINMDLITSINNLRSVVKNDPKNSKASSLLAEAHDKNNESGLAESELKKAIEANPVNPMVHYYYAAFLGSKGKPADALKIIDEALINFKDSYKLLELKLKLVASQGDNDKAIELLNKMKLVDSAKADPFIVMGQYYLANKQFDKSLNEFEQAYNRSIEKFKPLELIVRTYMLQNKVSEAKARIQKEIDSNSDDAVANYLMAQLYLSQNEIDKAKAYLKLTIDEAGQWLNPYATLASIHLIDKDFDGAIKVYRNAEEKVSQKASVLMQIASLYERKKDYSEAMSIYKSVLDADPMNKIAANNYASLLLDFGKSTDVDQALKISLDFENHKQPALIDTLGWAYAKSGNNTKAVEVLSPIVDKEPKVAIFRYHLGYALYNIGDKDGAKLHLEVAVSSDQTYAGKDKAKELLDNIY